MTILTFLYIFNFNFIKGMSITSSAFVVALLLFVYCILNLNYNKQVSIMFGSKYNRMLILYMIALIFLAILMPIVHMTFDFSFAKVLLHQLINLEIGIFLVALCKYKRCDILETVINCFWLQSIIQVSCFLSPTLLQLTDILREESLITKRNTAYTGFRGLAISGSNFFGLAVVYAMVFILLAFYWNKWEKKIGIKILCLACLIFGGLSAGRTSIIGMFIFLIVMLYKTLKRVNNKKIANNIVFVFILFLVTSIFFNIALKDYFSRFASWQYFKRYLFQFLGDGSANGSTVSLKNISSLNTMFNMYFKMNLSQVLFGDGCYTNSNGAYYMYTDVGYMRNPLFWGIFCSLFLYWYQFRFLMKNAYTKKSQLFAWVMFFSIVIFEIKGQVMGFLIISQCLLLLICCGLNEFDEKSNSLIISEKIKCSN